MTICSNSALTVVDLSRSIAERNFRCGGLIELRFAVARARDRCIRLRDFGSSQVILQRRRVMAEAKCRAPAPSLTHSADPIRRTELARTRLAASASRICAAVNELFG